MNDNNQIQRKKEKLPKFLYLLKLKTAIYGFVFFLLLSSEYAYYFLNMVFNNSLILLNNKNEPTILARNIMALILAIILFIF